MATLPGYERLPGSARRVRTPDGSTISRREYENRVAAQSGFRNWREWQKLSADPRYRKLMVDAVREQKVSVKQLRARGSDFNRKYLAAKRQGFGADDATPDGAMADLLVYTGRRRNTDIHNVGDSPK